VSIIAPVSSETDREALYKRELGEVRKSFGANLRRLRRARGLDLSQEDLAALADLHRTEIGKLEQGVVEPRLTTLLILAEALQAPVGELLEGLSAPAGRRPAPGARRRAGGGGDG